MYLIAKQIAPALAAACLLVGCAAQAADITITPNAGGFNVHTASYDAMVLPDGGLAGLRSGATEFLNATNQFQHAGYFFQDGILALAAPEQQGNAIVAKSEKASVKYDFGVDTVTCTVTNLTAAQENYFVIIDQRVRVAAQDKGEFVKTPLTQSWDAVTFYRDDAKLKAAGCTKLWGPWNDQQVFDVTLGGNESKQFSFTVTKSTGEEQVKVAQASIPAELQASDLNVLSPKQYQVFQRRSRYDGQILVSGWARPECDKIQVRVTGKSLKGDLPDKWRTILIAGKSKQFNAQIPATAGGWYTVELRAMKGKDVVVEAKVEKVGVGEVFVGAGQSNSTNCGQFTTKETSGMVSSFSGDSWQIADDPQPGCHDKTPGGSFWPAFGDAMYAKYHVPIGVAVTGHGGTSVDQWQPDNALGLFPWMVTRMRQLGKMGFRGVLWHQGESDAGTPTELYVQKMSIVIRGSQIQAGWDFPWFVAHASYHSPEHTSWPLVREAQTQLWKTGVALEGPDTDVLQGDNRDFDGKGIHFSPKGLKAHGQMWAEKVGAYLDSVLDK